METLYWKRYNKYIEILNKFNWGHLYMICIIYQLLGEISKPSSMRKQASATKTPCFSITERSGGFTCQVAKRKEERRSRTDTTPPGGRFLDQLSLGEFGLVIWVVPMLKSEVGLGYSNPIYLAELCAWIANRCKVLRKRKGVILWTDLFFFFRNGMT